MIAIEALRTVLSEDANIEILALFAFIPARYDSAAEFALPGGLGADIWTFVSYALLHGNWVHLLVNLVWMLAFASPVARRFGTVRFILFCVVTAVAGAAAHLAAYPGAMVPMIGASAVVSGAMAAAVRFAFSPGGPLGPPGAIRDDHQPAASLLGAFREPRVLVFVAVWVALNFLFGVGISVPGTEGSEIAWQAHMGGFFAGLLLFSFFDPVPPAARSASLNP
ncbi:rhomboid family intramembrane serine protease [Aquabacter sp. CN5-332]|uniref:rhomboid family intramembrane serine protease n=1 Tax=Aquabacter sp. CN5-332 TaxID=3156608 RepID=UPI0032B44148